MINAKSLLDQFIGQVDPGAQNQQAAPGQGNQMDLSKLLQGKGGIAAGALAGGLAGVLMGGKKSRKLAKSAVKMGGLALVGGLAYKAYRDWQSNQTPAQTAQSAATDLLPPPSDTAFVPDSEPQAEELSRALIRAMIAAAKADGHISAQEQDRISDQLANMNLSPDDRRFIEEQLAAPIDIAAVTNGINSREQAAEIYAASLLAIDPSGAAERGYLAMLAARLNLSEDLVQHLHAAAQGIASEPV